MAAPTTTVLNTTKKAVVEGSPEDTLTTTDLGKISVRVHDAVTAAIEIRFVSPTAAPQTGTPVNARIVHVLCIGTPDNTDFTGKNVKLSLVVPTGVGLDTVEIAFYDDSTAAWVPVETLFATVNGIRIASAVLLHFTAIALVGKHTPPAASAAPTTTPVHLDDPNSIAVTPLAVAIALVLVTCVGAAVIVYNVCVGRTGAGAPPSYFPVPGSPEITAVGMRAFAMP
jgi:hypothetical protein